MICLFQDGQRNQWLHVAEQIMTNSSIETDTPFFLETTKIGSFEYSWEPYDSHFALQIIKQLVFVESFCIFQA